MIKYAFFASIALISQNVMADGFEDKTDRFTQKRIISYTSTPEYGEFSTNLFVIYEKNQNQPIYYINLLTGGKGWRYNQCRSNNWLIDGEPVPELRGEYDSAITPTGVRAERFFYITDRKTIERIVSSKNTEFKICQDEFPVKNSDIKGIRKVLDATN